MKLTDPERMAQACQTYIALLGLYPNSFQQEYSDILAQHFRDEYCEMQESGEPMFRFWIFIIFDFIRSLLREHQEEMVKMVKKNFFVYSAIAAGIAALLWAFLVNGPYTMKPYFLAESGWFLFFAMGSLTLIGVAKATQSHLLFRMLPIFMLGASFVFLPLPRAHSFKKTWDWLGASLGMDEQKAIGFLLISYFIVIGIIGIIALVKRKWLPGITLLSMIVVPVGLTAFVNWLPMIIPSMGSKDNDWVIILSVFLFTVAWFTIAWWLKKENERMTTPATLEAA